MQRPTWATVVGILAILFGSFGVIGGAQEIVMPYMLDMQKDMMQNMNEMVQEIQKKELEKKSESSKNVEHHYNPLKIFDFFSDKMDLPDWYRTYALLFGVVSMLIAGFYLLCGILLLMLKPLAPLLFKITLAFSILWGVISGLIYGLSDNFVLIMSIPGSVAGIVIDIVLLVVIFVGNKEAFQGTENSTV